MNQTTAATKTDKEPAPRRRSTSRTPKATRQVEPAPAVEEEIVQPDDSWSYEEAWPDPEESSPPSRRRFKLAIVLTAALAAIVLAALGFSLYRVVSQNDQSALRNSALKAADQYGVYLSSYHYSDLDGPTAPWTLVEKSSTPSFRTDFDKTKSSLSTLVRDYHATATGKVVASGVSSVTSSRAVVLLFIDQTVTNSAQKPGSQTQPLRVELVLARSHGRWLIDKLDVPN
jgi:Mce-associated membrane protein